MGILSLYQHFAIAENLCDPLTFSLYFHVQCRKTHVIVVNWVTWYKMAAAIWSSLIIHELSPIPSSTLWVTWQQNGGRHMVVIDSSWIIAHIKQCVCVCVCVCVWEAGAWAGTSKTMLCIQLCTVFSCCCNHRIVALEPPYLSYSGTLHIGISSHHCKILVQKSPIWHATCLWW